jgi:hypothetical protein
MADPARILALLKFVGSAATLVCYEIDMALNVDYGVRQALRELRNGIVSLRSDTMVYKVLLSAMESDTTGCSIYKRFIQV